MKKQIIQISLFALVISSLFVACKSDSDSTAPAITLNGRNPDSLAMLVAYVDLGATAKDDKDGTLTSSIAVDVSDVDNKLPDSYIVTYSVSDAAGNSATAQRDVVVYANPAGLARNYTVKDSCGTGAALLVFNYSQSPVAFNGTQIKFNKFADYGGNTSIVATVNRDGTINLPSQSVTNIGGAGGNPLENHTFVGTGHVTATGFMLEYTDHNDSNGSSANCKAYFSRV